MVKISEEKLPILKVHKEDIAENVIVCGDPGRVDRVIKNLDEYEEISYNREYRVVGGRKDGCSLSVVSHGVGAAGALVCFEELIKAGARNMIRVGTAGSLDRNIKDGDLVVVSGAVREDGVTDQLVPVTYPAVSDASILKSLEAAAGSLPEVNYHTGFTVSLGVFYPGLLELPNSLMAEANARAVEMECSALFVAASLKGVRAGAILAIDGPAIEFSGEDYNPYREKVEEAIDNEIKIALRALENLNN